jgi:hypothetical protein
VCRVDCARHHRLPRLFGCVSCTLAIVDVQVDGVPWQQQLPVAPSIQSLGRDGANVSHLNTSWHSGASGAMKLDVYSLSGTTSAKKTKNVFNFDAKGVAELFPGLKVRICFTFACKGILFCTEKSGRTIFRTPDRSISMNL